MNKKYRQGLRTWLEIDKKALKHNYKIFRSLINKQTKLMAVVKSNAYGHNLTEFALEQEKLGVDYLAVDSVVEGLALRKSGIKKPILILGYTLPEMLEKVILNDLEITISNFEYFKEIKKFFNKNKKKQPIKIHIKIDTGMHRHGFLETEILKIVKLIKNNTLINVIGLYTHFSSAKNPAFPQETYNQINIFNKWREAFTLVKIKPIYHTCATSSTILFPEAHFDMVRVGIGLYGIWPSSEVRSFVYNKFVLQPILSWKTIIGEIKKVPIGSGVGYDLLEKLSRDSKIAILPVGYWHGYPRALSSVGQILINGEIAKVIGRVCMDIIIVDITNIKNTKVGDEVTIIGCDKDKTILVDDISSLINISPYEMITRINPLIKRIYK